MAKASRWQDMRLCEVAKITKELKPHLMLIMQTSKLYEAVMRALYPAFPHELKYLEPRDGLNDADLKGRVGIMVDRLLKEESQVTCGQLIDVVKPIDAGGYLVMQITSQGEKAFETIENAGVNTSKTNDNIVMGDYLDIYVSETTKVYDDFIKDRLWGTYLSQYPDDRIRRLTFLMKQLPCYTQRGLSMPAPSEKGAAQTLFDLVHEAIGHRGRTTFREIIAAINADGNNSFGETARKWEALAREIGNLPGLERKKAIVAPIVASETQAQCVGGDLTLKELCKWYSVRDKVMNAVPDGAEEIFIKNLMVVVPMLGWETLSGSPRTRLSQALNFISNDGKTRARDLLRAVWSDYEPWHQIVTVIVELAAWVDKNNREKAEAERQRAENARQIAAVEKAKIENAASSSSQSNDNESTMATMNTSTPAGRPVRPNRLAIKMVDVLVAYTVGTDGLDVTVDEKGQVEQFENIADAVEIAEAYGNEPANKGKVFVALQKVAAGAESSKKATPGEKRLAVAAASADDDEEFAIGTVTKKVTPKRTLHPFYVVGANKSNGVYQVWSPKKNPPNTSAEAFTLLENKIKPNFAGYEFNVYENKGDFGTA